MNEFDKGFKEWLTGCYSKALNQMPVEQLWQIEAAFYAGAAFAGRVSEEHGHDVVIEAILRHVERQPPKLPIQ